MTINITALLMVVMIGLASIVMQKVLKELGSERSANIVGIVEWLIGISVVIGMLKGIMDDIFSMFL